MRRNTVAVRTTRHVVFMALLGASTVQAKELACTDLASLAISASAIALPTRGAAIRSAERIPPTERKGRVHTSTVTVALMPISEPKEYRLRDGDIEIFTTRDTGPGGQHRNKTESCVVMRHKPTGIQAKAATKSQHRNKVLARQVLDSVSSPLPSASGRPKGVQRR